MNLYCRWALNAVLHTNNNQLINNNIIHYIHFMFIIKIDNVITQIVFIELAKNKMCPPIISTIHHHFIGNAQKIRNDS